MGPGPIIPKICCQATWTNMRSNYGEERWLKTCMRVVYIMLDILVSTQTGCQLATRLVNAHCNLYKSQVGDDRTNLSQARRKVPHRWAMEH